MNEPSESPQDALARYSLLKAELSELQDKANEVKGEIHSLQERLIQHFDGQGIQNTTMNIPGLGKRLFYRQTVPWPRIKDKEKFDTWCKANGFDPVTLMAPNAQKLKSWWKDRMESGQSLPPDDTLHVWRDEKLNVQRKA